MILTSKYEIAAVSHRLVPLSAEEREPSTQGFGGERPHPTARQYAVHRYGSRVGTLIKWWMPSPCAGTHGSWVWTFHDNATLQQIDFDTLALAKRALSVKR